MDEFNLIDLLDSNELPLKNRVSEDGYYSPAAMQKSDHAVSGSGLTTPAFHPEDGNKNLIPLDPLEKGEQYRFHFDMTLCIGCQCCVVA